MEQINKLNQEELIELVTKLKEENSQLKRGKKYGLVWEDTKEELDTKPVIPMIKKEESLNVGNINEEPRNYLIEGDNYHSLKVLQHTHKNKIDVIYIDPPYNTGNEFVYNDKIVDKEDNFRHSKWLSFMDKRLRLARNLMTDDGVIFVSIDDNEQAQLKLLMDEIFGEQNFISNFIWKKDTGGNRKNVKKINKLFEYILIYKKQESVALYEDKKIPKMTNPDNDPRGDWFNANISSPVTNENEKNVYTLDIQGHLIKRRWFKDKNVMEDYVKEDKIYLPIKSDGTVGVPRLKLFEEDFLSSKNIMNNYYEYKGTSDGVTEVSNMQVAFDYPKPVDLIKHLVGSIDNTNITVLDFFAGSGTTGHAVMELNKEDGGNRKFILCTNNEVSEEKVRQHFVDKGLLDKNTKTAFNKFKEENKELVEEFYQSEEYQQLGIARSVTRERIKRVSEGYTTPKGVKVEGLGGNLEYYVTEEFSEEDIHGFKRNQLAELALNSHSIKYPTNKYQNILVGTFTNLDDVELDKTKKPTFLINARDNETLSKRMEEITQKFGNSSIVHSIEDYYGEF